ncbi:MAG: hypothetical protein IPN66_07085 [Candidatus Competibacteraceae bacterium]|mgnify:CR=1 FL=1|nr:hypothetical protein [Candidatus Competibacteraceae bacterium]MBK8896980.1 hypothetical protein [Candidatus Competibacteraceae bacterium]
MRKIFQIDGLDGSVLSVGERVQPQQAAICISNSDGKEIHMLISYESFRELCSIAYDIHWAQEPRPVNEDEDIPEVFR